MQMIQCPECGQTIAAGFNSCPLCGYPLKTVSEQPNQQQQQQPVSTYHAPVNNSPSFSADEVDANDYESVNSNGTSTPEVVLTILAWIIMVACIVAGLIACIQICNDTYSEKAVGFLAILIGIVLGLTSWSVIMLFVNISKNIRIIRDRVG